MRSLLRLSIVIFIFLPTYLKTYPLSFRTFQFVSETTWKLILKTKIRDIQPFSTSINMSELNLIHFFVVVSFTVTYKCIVMQRSKRRPGRPTQTLTLLLKSTPSKNTTQLNFLSDLQSVLSIFFKVLSRFIKQIFELC